MCRPALRYVTFPLLIGAMCGVSLQQHGKDAYLRFPLYRGDSNATDVQLSTNGQTTDIVPPSPSISAEIGRYRHTDFLR